MVGWGITNESKAIMGTKPDGSLKYTTDTAPVHLDGATFPHHLHDDSCVISGVIRGDPASCPGTECWRNFSALIEMLLVNPLLEDDKTIA